MNRKGILAVGRIIDGQVIPASTILGEEGEFHVKVDWEAVVADDRGVTNREVQQTHGYNLPVRSVFCEYIVTT